MKTLITRIKRLALALCLATPFVSRAAEPAAVWDGDFTATQTGYNLNRSGNALSQDNSTITIDQSVGVKVDFTTGFTDAMTVMFKYSDLTFDAQKTLATSFCSGGDENRTGVYAANGGTINGIWNTANWNNPSETLSESSGILAFCYHKSNGTSLYYVNTDGTRTELFNKSGLRASGDSAINGCTIGGERAKSGATLLGAATGMKISAIAIFEGILSQSDMTSYVWPSEIATVSVDADTTVAAINTLIAGVDASSKKVVVDVADGVTIDVDTAFEASKPTTIASEGNVTLSAETQPDASSFTAVDFDVKGALFRSWLTPGVVGFNFYKNRGNDTTDAIATGTWYSDANSKTGTSTELFSDGLSVLSWNCSTLYSQGGYYDQTGEEGTLLNGYLDDGSLNGKGVEVYLTNVPYETYDVIIYAASDTASGNFLAKTVNGNTYTWDNTTGKVVEGNTAWGKAALNTPVYGVNTLRIKNLTGALTIYGTAKIDNSRGGISAIQIMPPETPDNIRTYKLTLDGTDTTWTNGAWTLNDQSVEAPTAGYVEIDASASTVVTVDTAVSVASLTINGSEDVVVSIVTNGVEGSSFSTIGATVAGGVFKQGVANSVTGLVTVENGGTFDMNGLANGAALVIAGAGAGNWPWALGSSSGEVSLSTPPTLAGDAAIGGAGKIVLGASGGATEFPLSGFTLTKSGAGELYCYNVRTDNGTLDVAGGTLSFNQWTALDGSETIDRHTTVIVRNGAELKNNAGRRLWIDTLNVEAGATVTTTASGYFGVSTAFNGTCDTKKLQFNDGAVVTLDGDLTVETLVVQGDNNNTTVGSMELALAEGTNAATVTVSDTVTAVGSITVGAGVTPAFTGESDVTATLRYTSAPAAANIGYATAENWKGTFVADWAGNRTTALPLNSYGVEGSTVEVPDGQTLVGYIDVRANNTLTINPTIKVTGTLQLDNGFDYSTVVYKGVEGAGTLNLSFAPSHWIKHEIQVLDNYTGTIQCSAKTVLQLDSVKLATVPEVGESIDVTLTLAEGAQVLNASGVAGKIDIVGSTNKLELNSADGKLYVVEGTVTISITPVTGATVTAITVNGEAVEVADSITVPVGATVSVTYTGDDDHKVTGSPVVFEASATTTSVDTSKVTSEEYKAQVMSGTGAGKYTSVQEALNVVFATYAETAGVVVKVLDSEYTDAGTYDEYCIWDATERTYTFRTFVARISIKNYESLAAAVADATAGDTIVLLTDDSVSLTDGSQLVINKAITINGQGRTIYGKSEWTTEPSAVEGIVIDGDVDVTIQNVTLSEFGDKYYCNNKPRPINTASTYTGKLTLNTVTIEKFCRQAVRLEGGTFEITGCTITGNAEGKGGTKSDFFQQGIEVRGTAAGSISDTTITGIAAYFGKASVDQGWDGYFACGIVSWTTGTVTVEDCTVTGATVTDAWDNDGGSTGGSVGIDNTGNGTLTVSGSTTTVTASFAAVVLEDNDSGTLAITGGTYTGVVRADRTTGTLTSTDNTLSILEGFEWAGPVEGVYTLQAVTPSGEAVVPGGESATTYTTETEAQEAAASTTVEVLSTVATDLAANSVSEDDYKALFQAKAVEKTDGSWAVEVVLADEVQTAVDEAVADAEESIIEDVINGEETTVTVATKPGLYYSLSEGATLETMSQQASGRVMGDGNPLTLTPTKFEGSGFYSIEVNAIP